MYEETRLNVGDRYPTNLWGDVIIVEYHGNKNVVVEFINTGYRAKTQKQYVLSGQIKDISEHNRIIAENKAKEKSRKDNYKVMTEQRRQASLERINKENVEREEARKRRCALKKQKLEQNRIKNRHPLTGVLQKDKYDYEFKIVDNKKKLIEIEYVLSGNKYTITSYRLENNKFYDIDSEEVKNKVKAILKIKHVEHYEKNREERLAKAKQWQKDNPDKANTRNRNRRASRKKAVGEHTTEQTDALYIKQDGRCACCCVYLDTSIKHLDHIMPLILGGSNSIENLQWLCQFCNTSKSGSHPDVWKEYSESENFRLKRLSRITTETGCWLQSEQSTPHHGQF